MALFRHGLRRFTEDVDILVTKGDFKVIHEKLESLGCLPQLNAFVRTKFAELWRVAEKYGGIDDEPMRDAAMLQHGIKA